jgi:GPI mannosyltransferase 2
MCILGVGAAPSSYRVLTAVAISHISHFLSVLVLYQIVYLIGIARPNSKSSSSSASEARTLAFIAGCLHVFSPAGMFLSAPYAESAFALLNFLGTWIYVAGFLAKRDGMHSWKGDILTVGAGAVFGLATTMRSNGLLNGVLYLLDVYEGLRQVAFHDLTFERLRRLGSIGLGGVLIGAGTIVPQWIAYLQFCGNEKELVPPWCTTLVPSIYSYVQDHYWYSMLN